MRRATGVGIAVAVALARPGAAGAQQISVQDAVDVWTGVTSLDMVAQDLTAFGLEPLRLEWQAGAQGFGGIDDGRVAAGATVGGALVVPGSQCRIVDIGAQGALQTPADTPYSGQAWASLCGSYSGQIDMRVLVSDKAILWVRPAITARRMAFRDTTSGNVFRFEWLPLAWHATDVDTLDFWYIDFNFNLFWTRASGGLATNYTGGVDMYFDMIRWWKTHPDVYREVDIMQVGAHILGFDATAGTIDIVPLRLAGMHFGGVLVDAWGGYTHAGVTPPVSSGSPLIEVHNLDLFTGHLGVRWRESNGVTLGAEVDRSAWPTLDSAVIVDSRAGGWVSWVVHRTTTVTFTGYVAYDQSYYSDGSKAHAPVGGGTAKVTRELWKDITASLTAEAAETLSTEAGETVPDTTARGFLVISGTYGGK